MPWLLFIAGVALPGLGHLLQKRRGHALLFAACVIVTFAAGMFISGWTAIDPTNHDVYWLLQSAAGAPAWVARWGGLMREADLGEGVSVGAQSIGITYAALAGVMNLLSVMELLRHDPRRRLPVAHDAAPTAREAAP